MLPFCFDPKYDDLNVYEFYMNQFNDNGIVCYSPTTRPTGLLLSLSKPTCVKFHLPLIRHETNTMHTAIRRRSQRIVFIFGSASGNVRPNWIHTIRAAVCNADIRQKIRLDALVFTLG